MEMIELCGTKAGSRRFARRYFGWAAAMALVFLWAPAQGAMVIQHWNTAKGARVYFVENHDLPLLDVSVEFPAGSSRDTAAKSGVAGLTASMLKLGAGGLSDNEISDRVADVGATLGVRFDRDRAGVVLRTLSSAKERDQALDVLARVVSRPAFPAAVLEREKARVMASLKEAQTLPEQIADKAFYSALYGSHPYGLNPAGEISTVNALSRDDVVSFYHSHYGVQGAVVALVGDVSREEAERIARQLTDNLPDSPAPGALPPVSAPVRAAEETFPHPAEQSHILMGYPGVRRIDPDYFPLYVGNYVLGGGGFDSRLTKAVREKRGLAYSVYSYFLPLQQQGPFVLGLQTKRQQTGEAVAVVRQVLRDFIAQGPTAAELRQAKNNLTGGFPLRIDSNKKMIEYLAVIGFYGLPLTYLDDFVARVNGVTLEQIRSAFARRIDPERMVTVIVGGGES